MNPYSVVFLVFVFCTASYILWASLGIGALTAALLIYAMRWSCRLLINAFLALE